MRSAAHTLFLLGCAGACSELLSNRLRRNETDPFRCAALDQPFLLLPFRPTSDPSAVRTFIRHFFDNYALRGETLAQELRMAEPMVRCLSEPGWCGSDNCDR